MEKEIEKRIEDAIMRVLEIVGETTLERLGHGVAVLLRGDATGAQVKEVLQRMEARGLVEVRHQLTVKPR